MHQYLKVEQNPLLKDILIVFKIGSSTLLLEKYLTFLLSTIPLILFNFSFGLGDTKCLGKGLTKSKYYVSIFKVSK